MSDPDFNRMIVAVTPLDNGISDEATLDCGHTIIRINPIPSLDTAYCAECLHDYLEKRNKIDLKERDNKK